MYFKPYVHSVWFYTQLRNCVRSTQFLSCTVNQTFSTKTKKFVLDILGLSALSARDIPILHGELLADQRGAANGAVEARAVPVLVAEAHHPLAVEPCSQSKPRSKV